MFFLILIGLIIAPFFYMLLSRHWDFVQQKIHLRRLAELYDDPRDIPDLHIPDTLPINSIRVVATHNSYRKHSDPLRLFFVGLESKDEVAALQYTNKTLYEQLNINVRSFEFDLRTFRKRFFNNHVPLVDDRSIAPDFRRAVQELKIWSERNPSHVPISVLVELKEDWRILAPWHGEWNAQKLVALDAVFLEVLGEKVIRPQDVMGDASSLRDAVLNKGWPTLGESRGKFILVLMIDDANKPYKPLYSENPNRCSFIMPQIHSPEAAFFLHDTPHPLELKKWVDQGFIIRTRADADLKRDFIRKKKAIDSKAQILSTDFPEGYDNTASGYALSWSEILKQ